MSEPKASSSVQDQFGSVAANYSTSAVHVAGLDLNAMVEAVPLTGQEKVLDAGCGAGHTALAFAPRVAQVIAYDLTEPMLAQVEALAQTRGINNVTTQQGDVADLPFEDATFDLVVTRYSAHHWPQPEKALAEFRRVLKPGGSVIFDDVVAPAEYMADSYLQTIEVLRDPSHVRDHSIRQWTAMFMGVGFVAVDVLLPFDVALRFETWTERMATPQANRAMILDLLAGAPESVRTYFKLAENWRDEQNFPFMLAGAVLRARME